MLRRSFQVTLLLRAVAVDNAATAASSATDAAGRAEMLRDIPAGTYKLKAWYERLPDQELEVIVPETGEVKVDFTLGVKNLPKY